MKSPAWQRLAVAGGAIIATWVVLGGCQKSDLSMQRIDASNLRILASLWSQCTGQNRGKPPANEQEFKTMIKSLRPEQLAAMKITDVDKLFVSERDNKPYVILYGQQSGSGGTSGSVMGYEHEGKDGKRLVAMTFGQVQEADEAQFKKLVPADKKP